MKLDSVKNTLLVCLLQIYKSIKLLINKVNDCVCCRNVRKTGSRRKSERFTCKKDLRLNVVEKSGRPEVRLSPKDFYVKQI